MCGGCVGSRWWRVCFLAPGKGVEGVLVPGEGRCGGCVGEGVKGVLAPGEGVEGVFIG